MTPLKEGDKAPNFEGKNQDGKTIKLSDYLGKNLILYFYPKDSTPGCTANACDFRDNYKMWQNKGYEILGISVDSEKSHQKFIQNNQLPFDLIADTDKSIVNEYGVWGRKKFMGREYDGIFRTTFVIDAKGIIKNVIEKVDTQKATAQLLKLNQQ